MAYHFLGPDGVLPDHLKSALDDPFVQKLLALVDQLDVSVLVAGFREDGSGGRPYDPYLMAVSTAWCFQNGIRQPERMAEECRTRTQLLALWGGGRTPKASTFRRFITGRKPAWQSIEVDVLRACGNAGLLDPTLTATDSSPMDSPASLRATRSLPRIRLDISQTQRELEELAIVTERTFQDLDPREDLDLLIDQVCGTLAKQEQKLRNRLARLRRAEAVAEQRTRESTTRPPPIVTWINKIKKHEEELQRLIADQNRRIAEWAAHPGSRRGSLLPPEQLARFRKKQDELDHARVRLAAAYSEPSHRGHQPRANLTEPDSWLLPGKNTTTWVQGHLAMLTVTGTQIVLSARLHQGGNDQGGLHPSLRTAADNCGLAGVTTPMRAHLADAGFASTTTFTTPTPTGGTLYVSVTNEAKQTSLEQDQKPPKLPKSRQEMADRLATPQGKALYKRRSQMVEPVFSHLFTRGGRHLHTRGPAAEIELIIMASVHNGAKYIRHQSRNHHKQQPRKPLPPAHNDQTPTTSQTDQTIRRIEEP